MIAQPGIQIVDVRTPAEFADGHIAGAVNIGAAARLPRAGGPAGPEASYAVYCRSGHRSKSAVAQMQGAGITHIYELAAGLNDWTAEGHRFSDSLSGIPLSPVISELRKRPGSLRPNLNHFSSLKSDITGDSALCTATPLPGSASRRRAP